MAMESWTPAELEAEQRMTQDKFVCYRAGQPWNEDERQDFIRNTIVPRPLNVHEALGPGLSARMQRVRDANVGNARYKRYVEGEKPISKSAKRIAHRQMNSLLWQYRDQLKFQRRLGWSGAFISLWEWKKGRKRQRAVFKNALGWLSGDRDPIVEGINLEKGVLTDLARAPHIIQRFRVGPFLGLRGARHEADDQDGTLWLDWARRGDLNRLLCEIGEAMLKLETEDNDDDDQNVTRRRRRDGLVDAAQTRMDALYIPKAMLWQIFHCLVKAGIALTWPPRLQAGPRADSEYSMNGKPLPEEIPAPGRRVQKKDYLHMDIDPKNIFIGDNDTRNVPLFMIADLGASETVGSTRAPFGKPTENGPPYSIDAKFMMWTLRAVGKDGNHTPEQFTQEWDRVQRQSDPFTDGISQVGNLDTVAGHYGEWSNVWQIGAVMWSCVTMQMANMPPVPGQMGVGSGVYSYGKDIMKPEFVKRYGKDLCSMINGCMMHTPAHRPTLAELDEKLASTVPERGAWLEAEKWARRVFRSPKVPTSVQLEYPAKRYKRGRVENWVRVFNQETKRFEDFDPFD